VLLELMEGQPRLVGAACAVKVPDSGGLAASGRRPAGAGQIHCQREYNRHSASFAVRPPGRIYADNLVVFPYFTDCRPGDGGLIIVRTSLSLQRRVGPAH
jgi:hypothetical protein